MRIWFLTISEPWPTDGENPRLLRTGVMARRFARQGDEVVWFNSSFRHMDKTHRFDGTVTMEIEKGLTMIGLHAPGYRRNISLARIRHNIGVTRIFGRMIEGMPPPDLIMASWPIPEMAYTAARYAAPRRIPLVVDVRDLWPDIWREAVPAPLRPLASLVFAPYYRMLRRVADQAAAITGTAEPMVQWGLDHCSRARNGFDGALPLVNESGDPDPAAEARAEVFWDKLGVGADQGKLVIFFVGALSNRYEFRTVFDALDRLAPAVRARLQVVLCGAGEARDWMQERAAGMDGAIVLPGWVNACQIATLSRRARIGLLPYPSSQDYVRSMPNKTFDYFSGGLPVLTCLKGVTGDFIAENQCGWLYENNDPDSLAALLQRLEADRDEVARAALRTRDAATGFTAEQVYGDFRRKLDAIVAAAR